MPVAGALVLARHPMGDEANSLTHRHRPPVPGGGCGRPHPEAVMPGIATASASVPPPANASRRQLTLEIHCRLDLRVRQTPPGADRLEALAFGHVEIVDVDRLETSASNGGRTERRLGIQHSRPSGCRVASARTSSLQVMTSAIKRGGARGNRIEGVIARL